jgi:hypothetical protein
MTDTNTAPSSGADSGDTTGYEGVTPQQAQAEIANLMADADFRKAITSANHPGNAQARAQWNYLHRAASGAAPDTPGVTRDNGVVVGGERSVSSSDATKVDIPATPDGYRINAAPIGRDRSTPPEVHAQAVATQQALHEFAKSVAHAGQFTQSDLDAIVVAWDQQNAALSKGMTPQAVDAQYDQTLAELAREHGGPDAAMQRVKLANSVLNGLQPEARQKAIALLRVSGLGNNRILIERLAAVAERRAKGGAA